MSRLVVAMEELVEVGDIWSEEAGGNSDGSGEDIWRLTKLTDSNLKCLQTLSDQRGR